MPRKSNNKNSPNTNKTEKTTRTTTRRPSSKRSDVGDQQAGGDIQKVNDHEKAFHHPQHERGEVY